MTRFIANLPNIKILITGAPRSGKSTLITKLIGYFISQKNLKILGFLTPEVKEFGKRVGFDIEDIFSKERLKLARIGNYKTQYKLGKYNIFIHDFEKYLVKIENVKVNQYDLIIVDEIGKMELFSSKFQDLIKNLFQLNNPIIATIGEKLAHPLKNYILKLPEVILFNLNLKNHEEIFHKIKLFF